MEGYEKLITDLGNALPDFSPRIREVFQLQEENFIASNTLLDYNIKPRDILEIIPDSRLQEFCEIKSIKARGDLIVKILDAYKDSENLYLENYENIAYRNINTLKENGITLKESELGLKFEELTKMIFLKLGFNVDEKLRKEINTNKDIIDVVINLGNNDLILVECKTNKEAGYNKFSSVSRQLKAYSTVAKNKNYKVIKSLLIAPEFSDDFIKECGLDYELNLSLITAGALKNIVDGFRETKLKVFPYNLFMRDVLIQEERILKALDK